MILDITGTGPVDSGYTGTGPVILDIYRHGPCNSGYTGTDPVILDRGIWVWQPCSLYPNSIKTSQLTSSHIANTIRFSLRNQDQTLTHSHNEAGQLKFYMGQAPFSGNLKICLIGLLYL